MRTRREDEEREHSVKPFLKSESVFAHLQGCQLKKSLAAYVEVGENHPSQENNLSWLPDP